MRYCYLNKIITLIIIIIMIGAIIIPAVNGDINKIKILKNKEENSKFFKQYDCIPKLNKNFDNENFLYAITNEFGIHKYSNYSNNFSEKQFENVKEIKINKIKRSYGVINKEKIVQKSNIKKSGDIYYVGGSGPNNFTSIQDAIENASAGDTVFVYNESSPYYENIIIDKPIQLIGENKDNTFINGSKLDSLLDTINITANNVYIQGFGINYNIGDYYQAAILINGDYITITDCKIFNNNWIGISFLGSTNSHIYNCEFYYNLIGIHMIDSNKNIIENCVCNENSDDIILFENSHNNKILNCSCIGNSFSGIHIQHSSGNHVINCTIKNGYEGIGLAYAPNTKMQNNNLINNKENFGIGSLSISDFICNIDTSNKINGKPIIYWINHHNEQIPSDAAFIGLISCTNITVKYINISNNFQGIVCVETSKSIIENCNFLNNGGHGLFFVKSSNNKIQNCSCTNNFFSGLYLNYLSNHNNIFNNFVTNIQVCGVWVEESICNKIIKHSISNCNKGISLDKSKGSILRDNNMISCGLAIDGITLYDYINDIDASNKVNGKTLFYFINETGLNIPTNAGQVVLINCTNCNISNLDLSNGTIGIELAFSSNNTISKNIINNNNLVAIDLDCSNNNYNTIFDNTIFENNYGIDVDLSDNNIIKENIIDGNRVAISLDFSDRNYLLNNEIENSYNGIYITNSNLNQLNNNSIQKCSFTAIYLLYSKNNILNDNKMNNCGLIVYGASLSEYINYVDTSNKVNEKVVYYLLNKNGFTVPKNAGQVILINCDYCTVSNLELSNGTVGVELAYSDLNTITKNTLKNNKYSGVYIETSQDNKVESNTIENNSYGISMQLADKNDIKNNKIQTDYYGCYISFSNNNNFSGNNIIYNNYGIYFNLPSASNIIHQNNLYYNGINAYDENQKSNVWDNGKKGNYWGDYTKKYPNARRIWLKGIWNIPYEIPSKDNKDRFPLIFPNVLSFEKKGNFKIINLLIKIFENNIILKSIYELKNVI